MGLKKVCKTMSGADSKSERAKSGRKRKRSQEREPSLLFTETIGSVVAKKVKREDFNKRVDRLPRSLSPGSNTYTRAYLADSDEFVEALRNERSQEHKRRAQIVHENRTKRVGEPSKKVLIALLPVGAEMFVADEDDMTPGARNALRDSSEASDKERLELEIAEYSWLRVPVTTTIDLVDRGICKIITARK